MFFINALLIFPQGMVLVPLLTRGLVRARGGFPGEAPIVDTFPTIAEYLLPQVGWVLLIPLALVIYNLSIERAFWPRVGLVAFLLTHLAFLIWTAGGWVGLWGPTLPGGP